MVAPAREHRGGTQFPYSGKAAYPNPQNHNNHHGTPNRRMNEYFLTV
jgi:hypothetical protein